MRVFAAAIRSGATSIVTVNLADFPRDVLSRYDVEVLAPDESVLRLAHQDLDAVVEVVDGQAADLRNPPMSTAEPLDGLRVAGLPRTVAALLSGTSLTGIGVVSRQSADGAALSPPFPRENNRIARPKPLVERHSY